MAVLPVYDIRLSEISYRILSNEIRYELLLVRSRALLVGDGVDCPCWAVVEVLLPFSSPSALSFVILLYLKADLLIINEAAYPFSTTHLGGSNSSHLMHH